MIVGNMAGIVNEAMFGRFCEILDVSSEDIRSNDRHRELVYRRVILTHFLYDLGMSVSYIARLMGNRNHSTVCHYRRIWENEIDNNRYLRMMSEYFSMKVDKDFEGLKVKVYVYMSGFKDSDLQTIVDDMNRRLIKVSDYAKMKGVSTTGVYFWERTGKIRTVMISGVKFVVLDEETDIG